MANSNLNLVRIGLIVLFVVIFVGMLSMTVYASLDRSVFEAGPQLKSDPWFQATLVDAYFGFLTFYVWVAYKEKSILGRVIWFVLIMTLGNMAMAAYMLIQLWRWNPSRGAGDLLLRPPQTA